MVEFHPVVWMMDENFQYIKYHYHNEAVIAEEQSGTYTDRNADIRKALKNLSEAAPRWLGILRTLAGEPGFELARKEAIESGEDLADQAKRLLTEQTDYFNAHKEEKGQDRAEPK